MSTEARSQNDDHFTGDGAHVPQLCSMTAPPDPLCRCQPLPQDAATLIWHVAMLGECIVGQQGAALSFLGGGR